MWAPAGAEFYWDLGGDGVVDKTTTSPALTYLVGEGYQEIVVQVHAGGRAIGSVRLALTADPQLGAYRLISPQDSGVLEVTVVLKAHVHLFAPGIEESIPPGWAAEMAESGGSIYVLGNLLQAVWPRELMPGGEVSLKYLLHPAGAGPVPLSGIASAYGPEGRFEVRIGGMIIAP